MHVDDYFQRFRFFPLRALGLCFCLCRLFVLLLVSGSGFFRFLLCLIDSVLLPGRLFVLKTKIPRTPCEGRTGKPMKNRVVFVLENKSSFIDSIMTFFIIHQYFWYVNKKTK